MSRWIRLAFVSTFLGVGKMIKNLLLHMFSLPVRIPVSTDRCIFEAQSQSLLLISGLESAE